MSTHMGRFVVGNRSVVATPHRLASKVAIDIIERGGNAVDAAVAANAVVGTVLPTTCGIGGDLLALVHQPKGSAPEALNASGRSGRAIDSDSLRRSGHIHLPLTDPAAVTVPGCVDGWLALLQQHGSMSLGEVLAPAIEIANRGFGVSPELATSLGQLHKQLSRQQSASDLYPLGRPPASGDTLCRPKYGATLSRLAAEGRDGFYRGPVAEAIVRATKGILEMQDLEANEASWVEPLGIDIFGERAWTLPPNSQGYATLAASWMFHQLEPAPDPEDPSFYHMAIEAYRSVAWELELYAADPSSSPIAADRLLDLGRLTEKLERIRKDQVAHWPTPSTDRKGTAFMCVVDDSGMGVSLIQSNYTGIGSGIAAGDTGVWLHNRGAGFTLEPGHPNEAAPGKRPRHTLSPTLWTRDDSLSLLLGTQGGDQQPQYLLQLAALLLHAKLDPEAAQQHPRWHIDVPARKGTDGLSLVRVEQNMPSKVANGLARMGHQVVSEPAWQQYWGPVSLIRINPNGIRLAAADPRVSTTSVACN